MADMKNLFDAVRAIKGAPLNQADVDAINRALAGEIVKVADGMKTSAKGIALIHSFEAYRDTTYPDPGSKDGKPVTGGWGSTRDENGKPFALGVKRDRAYWDGLFLQNLTAFELGVNMLLAGAPTTQAQFDALISFAYNVGLDIDEDTLAEGLGDSTLLRKHLAGDYAGAAAQFAAWNKNDGQVMNGLIRRRAAEAKLYGGEA